MTTSERAMDSSTVHQASGQTPANFSPTSSSSPKEPLKPFKKTFWNQVLLVLGLIALALPFVAAIFFAAP